MLLLQPHSNSNNPDSPDSPDGSFIPVQLSLCSTLVLGVAIRAKPTYHRQHQSDTFYPCDTPYRWYLVLVFQSPRELAQLRAAAGLDTDAKPIQGQACHIWSFDATSTPTPTLTVVHSSPWSKRPVWLQAPTSSAFRDEGSFRYIHVPPRRSVRRM